jgi:predicted SnoaL-like aldol condensation-catalyzing enzyme
MKKLSFGLILCLFLPLMSCDKESNSNPDPVIEELTLEEKATELLLSLQNSDTSKVLKYIDPNQYIQHNYQLADGRDALVQAILNGQFSDTQITIKRTLSDDQFVAFHSEYISNGNSQVAFDVFRFENGLIVEHWDNMQAMQPENMSGNNMIDGPNAITNLDQTTDNRAVVTDFINRIMIGGDYTTMGEFLKDDQNLIQHNPMMADSLSGMLSMMDTLASQSFAFKYETLHKTIAMGNFVLALSEGMYGNPAEPTAFYDLFRLEEGKLVEHWDVIAIIAPVEDWQNSNGKF